jgi:hypothetical protein
MRRNTDDRRINPVAVWHAGSNPFARTKPKWIGAEALRRSV